MRDGASYESVMIRSGERQLSDLTDAELDAYSNLSSDDEKCSFWERRGRERLFGPGGRGRSDYNPEAAKITTAPCSISASPFQWIDPADIPRRAWVYGRHYARKFISATIAPGGIGKSSLTIVEALAICTGRALLDVKPDEQANVWIHNGEDPLEELQRRIAAAALHFEIGADDLDGRLFLDSGREARIIVAEQTKAGAIVAAPVVEAVIKTIIENDIGVMIVDPFVSSHRVLENDNTAVEIVASAWAEIADVTGCSIEIVHHSRKTGGAETTVEDARGASALLARARSARVINQMTKEEAGSAGVENHRLFFRCENGKANLTIPADKATWYRLHSVDLGNGPAAAGGQFGDSVGVVVPWSWPDAFEGVHASDLLAVQRLVDKGKWRESPQADDWIGKAVAEALKLDTKKASDAAKIKALLKTWIGNGMFVKVKERDENRVERPFIKVGEWAT